MFGELERGMEALPLVSCIMPTYNRRQFVPRAIEYFLQQDYAARELIVVDDGTDPVGDLMPDDAAVRYLRLDAKHTLGAKRNLACREAQGPIIVHWDDDDWIAPWRLSYQVEALLREQADICGLDTLLFYDIEADRVWQYVYPQGARSWLAGGTLCYTRAFWQRNPFPQINVGEDARFLWTNSPKKMVALEDGSFYVALIHPQNSSPKKCQGSRWLPWTGDLQQVMGGDLNTYRKQGDSASSEDSGSSMVKLNLGCCDSPLPGFVNVDIVPSPGIEVADLTEPWPWTDGSVEHVRAWDIIEHLPDKIFTMNELWRILTPGGTAEIVVPTTDGPGAFQDPTHVSFWNRRSFLYYEAGNPYRERFAEHYGIKAKFRTVRERTEPSVDGPRLTIVLQAVKP